MCGIVLGSTRGSGDLNLMTSTSILRKTPSRPSILSSSDSISSSSSSSLTLPPLFETKGAQNELNSIKKGTLQNRLQRLVGIYFQTSRWHQSGKSYKLKGDLLIKSQENFKNLQLNPMDDQEIGVHYKILYQSFYNLKVFNSLQIAQEFIETLFPNCKYITFQQLLQASKSNDGTIRDALIFYLTELAKDKELPTPLQPIGGDRRAQQQQPQPKEEVKLFKTKNTENGCRLQFISRQKQAILPSNDDENSSVYRNYSLRKSFNPLTAATATTTAATAAAAATAAIATDEQYPSPSIRMKQDDDCGYSYRKHSGAIHGQVRVITHSDSR